MAGLLRTRENVHVQRGVDGFCAVVFACAACDVFAVRCSLNILAEAFSFI